MTKPNKTIKGKMKTRKIKCRKCSGTGKENVRICRDCGIDESRKSIGFALEYGYLCQDCWAKRLGKDLDNTI